MRARCGCGAGRLTERVTIERNTPANDTQGGRASSWATLATVWGAVTPMRASEALELREFVGSTGVYDVVIRYRGDVTPSHRLSWTPYHAPSAKRLEIHGVQPMPDRQYLHLTCAEVV